MKKMKGEIVVFALWSILLAFTSAAAQQTPKVPRVGFLASGEGGGIKPLLQRIEELGYVVGKTVFFEHRSARRQLDRLPDLAAELARMNVDLIVAVATPAVLAAKNETTTIPIVMVDVGDPVATNLIPDLARPGGNITGLATLSPELSGKRLELLKEAVPTANSNRGILKSNQPHKPAPNRTSQICSQGAGCGDTNISNITKLKILGQYLRQWRDSDSMHLWYYRIHSLTPSDVASLLWLPSINYLECMTEPHIRMRTV